MPSDKVFSSADAAVADIPDGAVVMVGGYAVPGTPQGLVRALLRQPARGLTCISGPWYVNDPELHDVARLVAAGRVRKVITATPIRSSPIAAAAPMDRRRSGELEVEMVAQATLAERIRAGGAGLGDRMLRRRDFRGKRELAVGEAGCMRASLLAHLNLCPACTSLQ